MVHDDLFLSVLLEQVLSFYCPRRPEPAHLHSVRTMLAAALIFVISLAAMIQFAVFTWRAGLLRVASEAPESAASNSLQSNDFGKVSAYQQLCPELAGSESGKLRSVRLYYQFLQFLTSLSGSLFPADSGWTHREMVLCARYASVVLSQRLERNQAQIAEVRSF